MAFGGRRPGTGLRWTSNRSRGVKKLPEREFDSRAQRLPPTQFERDEKLIKFLSELLDTAFRLPGTNIRFGLDPIIGFIPGIGNAADALISAFLIWRSARYGLPRVVLARMVVNVAIDTIGGMVPVAGDIFSVFWRSNIMNYELLKKHAGSRQPVSTFPDWTFLILLFAGLFVAFGVALGALFLLAGAIIHLFETGAVPAHF